MRSLILLLAILLAAPAFAQEPRWSTPQANQFWPLKAERIRAYRQRDRAAFERILADDFVSLSPDGRILLRSEYLEAEFGPERATGVATDTEVSDFNVFRRGATLIMDYSEVEQTRVGESVFRTQLRRLDVYVRQGGRWRLQAMTAVRVPEAPPAISVSAERLQDYVGVYDFAENARSIVRLQGDRLVEQTTGQGEVALVPVGPDTFYAPPDVVARVEFERDQHGRVVAQIYRSGAQALRGPRLP